jgi:hypothetical protein
LYSNTSHALFGILYHELTSQNQGWMMIIFFHARASAQLP